MCGVASSYGLQWMVGLEAREARKLLEPRLKVSSLARIRDRVVIVGWEDLHGVYESIEPYKEFWRRCRRGDVKALVGGAV